MDENITPEKIVLTREVVCAEEVLLLDVPYACATEDMSMEKYYLASFLPWHGTVVKKVKEYSKILGRVAGRLGVETHHFFRTFSRAELRRFELEDVIPDISRVRSGIFCITSLGFRTLVHHSKKIQDFLVQNEPDADERRKYLAAGKGFSDEEVIEELNSEL